MCRALGCKYVAVSAALNHHVDDLLAGLVAQIRLNPHRHHADHPHQHHQHQQLDTPRCFAALIDFCSRLVGKQPSSTFDCDDLWTL